MTNTPEGPEERTRLDLAGWFGLEPNLVTETHTIDNDGDMFEVEIMSESENIDLVDVPVYLSIREGTDLRIALRLLQKITSQLEAALPSWEKSQGRDINEARSEILGLIE
jgi:hypothetical protein